MGRFKTIKGLSQERRLPRLGYIRLGVKVKRSGSSNCQCGPDVMCLKCSRPTETKHFIVPPEVAKVFGDEPTELDVALPLDSQQDVFPTALKMYKSSGLYCEGNGEEALRRNDKGQWDEMACPCDLLDARNGCKKVAVLNIIIPKVSWGGVYQIVTSSFNSIIDLNSGLDYIRSLIGRVVLVDKVKLVREPTPTTHTDDRGQTRKQTHYTMKIRYVGDEADMKRERLRSGEVLGKPRYLIADEDRSSKEMPNLIETSAPDVGADGSEVIDMETGEVLDTERTKPGDGDDAKPAKKPKPAKKAAKKAAKKPAKPKPAKPADPPAAPAPAAAAANPDAPINQAQVNELWEWAQRAWGADRLDDAKNFFGFFVKDYCAVKKSAEIPTWAFEANLGRLKEVAAVQDAGERVGKMAELVNTLQGEIGARASS